ncbi:MAG TPA: amidohydrolase family protein [Usitatibacter sp.]|nr:amidohydrolase family protein [Usitatibacter sp.]
MRRRDFLGAAGAAALLAGCDKSFEEGLLGDCRVLQGPERNPLVQAAWQGLHPDRVWDTHVHLFGNGRSRAGVWAAPSIDSPVGPESIVRKKLFMNGGCVGDDEQRVDQGIVARLATLAGQFPPGARFVLLAFDFTYDESGAKREDLTTFSVSDDYARRVVAAHPDRFEWMCSVHPYRADALEALRAAHAAGARAVKWLPPSMAIDLRSPRCAPFYDELVKLGMPLLVHVGEEKAVEGARRDELADPLLLRSPLERGVRVIGAHCATLGPGNFERFKGLMAERQYEGRLFGDISAITLYNRADEWRDILATLPRWEGRLLNGSDYPLVGILPLYSMNAMVKAGVLDERVVPALRELHQGNALLFDFVLKRNLRWGTAAIPASAFETRGFFA